MEKNSVVITGLGFVTSIGNDINSVFDSLVELRNGIEIYDQFADDKIPVKCVGTIKHFDTRSFDPEDWTYPPEYRIRRDILRSLPPQLHAFSCLSIRNT